MLNPSIWVVIGYLLTAPFSAALKLCILGHRYRELKKNQIWTAGILGIGLIVSVIKGMDGVLNMFPPFILVFCFALWCSAFFAVDCIRKKDAKKLDAWDIAWALVCYFGFLTVVFFIIPAIRWCEGCMEWH